MSTLPPELAPWRQALAPLAPDLALVLGPWMLRLRGALGTLPTAAPAADGEVDGYGALTRRGPYERLLLSEWALARALPLEFLRRAALGEHLFLDAERKSPRGDRRLVVLFDGGPDQLGSPRLAHLAVLAVLHQRAEAAGASFAWGLVHDPQNLYEGFDGETFVHLLEGRSTAPPQSDHLEVWRQHLASPGSQGEEHWWVGGEALARLRPGRGHGLRVEEAPEGWLNHLRLTVESPGRSVRRLELALPPPAQRVRLLRDPFASVPRRSAGPGTRGTVTFNPEGHRLLLQDWEQNIVALHVPNGPRESQGRHRRMPVEDDLNIAAATIVGRRWLAVQRRGTTWEVRGVGNKRQRTREPVRMLEEIEAEPATLAPEDPLPPCWQDPIALVRGKTVAWPLVFVDARSALFAVEPFEFRQMTCFYPRVAGICPTESQLLVAVEDPGTSRTPTRSLVAFEHTEEEPIELPGDGPLKVFFGAPGKARKCLDRALLAWRQGPGHWGLLDGGRRREMHPGGGCEILGVAREGTAQEVGLLVLEADRRTVQHVGLRFSRVVFRADFPVEHHTFHPGTSRLALVLNREGENRRELVIWSLEKSHFCLRQLLGEDEG